jgi:hypothetical protein
VESWRPDAERLEGIVKRFVIGVLLFVTTEVGSIAAEEVPLKLPGLRDRLTFHVDFDRSWDAVVAKGDPLLYTAHEDRSDIRPGVHRAGLQIARDQGRYGGALEFQQAESELILYRAKDNISYRGRDWEGTVSLWMKLNPDRDLPPGYCDPLQITDDAWNDSAMFVDFTKDETPRHFRLGIFADSRVWNPQQVEWDAFPVEKRPMVTVVRPPFSQDHWVHVAFTWEGFNQTGEPGTATFYLDGQSMGELKGQEQMFTWDVDRTVIMLGINFVGWMDDLSAFDRALTAEDIQALMRLPGGVADLANR